MLIWMISTVPATADIIDPARTTACLSGHCLGLAEQAALGTVHRTFRAVYSENADVSRQFTMRVSTPGAFQGDDFPKDVCGAEVYLTWQDGKQMQGILTYTRPDPLAEHHPYAYVVQIIDQPNSSLVFHAENNGIVWGLIRMPDDEHFFMGSDVWRWDN